MAKKTPEWPEYPNWTEARWWGFLRSALRRAYSKWPPKYEALRGARRECEGKGRQKYEYQCAYCKKWFPQKQVQVDHITPAGTLRSWDDLVPFTSRLFCSKNGLQVLCKTCHNVKTQSERGKKEV